MSSSAPGTSTVSDVGGEGSGSRPVVPLLNTIGASSVSEQPSSKSERTSLKQRYLTPQDVSMPDVGGYTKHTPIELKPRSRTLGVPAQSTEALSNIPAGQVLDGFMLLEATGMGFPNDARQAVLQGRKLQAVVEEDLIFYTGLLFLDVSDNLLPFNSFSVLPKLRELRMACNNIRDIADLTATSSSHQSNVQMASSLANPSEGGITLMPPPVPRHGGGFAKLMYLDLSYNRLTLESVRSLYGISSLVELDLTGNNLKNLPGDMYMFQNLERLNISRNRIQDNSIFVSCGSIYYLRSLNVSYNFLSQVPMAAINSPHPHLVQYGAGGGDQFRALDHLDISFNYVGNETDVQPLITLPRLNTVILYGNPILGSSGEDVLKLYIEDLLAASMEHRISSNMKDIDWITEIPIARNSTGGVKKSAELGRMARYKGVQVVAVDTNDEQEHKTGEEWRRQGRRTLFGEAVEVARKQEAAGVAIPDITTTFMTATSDNGHMSEMTNNVMEKVAESMNMTSTTELLMLKDRAMLPDSFLSDKKFSERMLQLDRESGAPLNENVPVNDLLYTRSLQDPHTLLIKSPPRKKGNGVSQSLAQTSHPLDGGDGETGLSMNAAVRSLRYSLAHPLTNYSEVPAKGFLPPKDYVRPTQSSTAQRLPRINKGGGSSKRNANPTLFDTRHISEADKHHGHTGVRLRSFEEGQLEPRKVTFVSEATKRMHDSSKMKTLTHLEEVLNSLNSNTATMLDVKYSAGGATGLHKEGDPSPPAKSQGQGQGQGQPITLAEEQVMMKRFARPNGQIKGLINMINATADDLDL